MVVSIWVGFAEVTESTEFPDNVEFSLMAGFTREILSLMSLELLHPVGGGSIVFVNLVGGKSLSLAHSVGGGPLLLAHPVSGLLFTIEV